MSAARQKPSLTFAKWNINNPQDANEEKKLAKLTQDEWSIHEGIVQDIVKFIRENNGEPKTEDRIKLTIPKGMSRKAFITELHDLYGANLEPYCTNNKVVDFAFRPETYIHRSIILKCTWRTASALYAEELQPAKRPQRDAKSPAAKAAKSAAASTPRDKGKKARSSSANISATLAAASSSSASESSPEASSSSRESAAEAASSPLISYLNSPALQKKQQELAQLLAENDKRAAQLAAKAAEQEKAALQIVDLELMRAKETKRKLELDEQEQRLKAADFALKQGLFNPAAAASSAPQADANTSDDEASAALVQSLSASGKNR